MKNVTKKFIQGKNEYGDLWRRFKRTQNLPGEICGHGTHISTVLVDEALEIMELRDNWAWRKLPNYTLNT